MTAVPSIPKALRLRATIAARLDEPEAVRLLRGFADAIERDPAAVGRIRGRVEECALLVDGAPVTPVVQVWRDALADLGTRRASAPVDGASAKALATLRAELRAVVATVGAVAADLAAERAAREAAEARVAVLEADAARRSEVAELLVALGRDLATETRRRQAAEQALAPCRTGPIVDRLRALQVPDGRTWLDVTREIAAKHGVGADAVASRDRTKMVTAARHEVWWWLRAHSAVGCSFPDIGRAWGRDHSTVMAGVRNHEDRRLVTVPPAPSSGPRRRASPEEEATG